MIAQQEKAHIGWVRSYNMDRHLRFWVASLPQTDFSPIPSGSVNSEASAEHGQHVIPHTQQQDDAKNSSIPKNHKAHIQTSD